MFVNLKMPGTFIKVFLNFKNSRIFKCSQIWKKFMNLKMFP